MPAITIYNKNSGNNELALTHLFSTNAAETVLTFAGPTGSRIIVHAWFFSPVANEVGDFSLLEEDNTQINIARGGPSMYGYSWPTSTTAKRGGYMLVADEDLDGLCSHVSFGTLEIHYSYRAQT